MHPLPSTRKPSRPLSTNIRRSLRCARPAVLLVLLGLVTAGCGGSSTSQGLGYITGDGVVEQIQAADRREMPWFEGDTLDGGHFDTDEHQGEVLVINGWGSWCPPCPKEAPVLQRLSEETRDRDVQFIGLNIRGNNDAAIAFERNFGITYPSITTADSGPPLLALRSFLPQGAVPSTVIVDRDGEVAARVVGKTTYVTLRDLVRDVLAEDQGVDAVR